MPSFDTRLQQLLNSNSHLTVNQRQRFSRPLRQVDVACQIEESVDEHNTEVAEVIKAATRVMSHQVLEVMCFHLENSLSNCRSESQRLLITAQVAHAMLNQHCVLFHQDSKLQGLAYPAAATLILQLNTTFNSQPCDILATLYRKTIDFDLQPNGVIVEDQSEQTPITKGIQIVELEKVKTETALNDNQLIQFSQDQIQHDPFACAKKILSQL